MSADLKDPATAIPKGTFLAIGTTSLTYAIIILFTGSTIVAYSSGNINDTLGNNRTCLGDCPYGLINDYQTMAMSGALAQTSLKVDPLIYAGIFAATLSSALGCYTAAPRIFKAFAEDNLIPFISWFGKGYGPSKDPRHGYVITFIIAALFIAIDDVNIAGVWIANFYLGAFFMVNVSLFYVSWVSSLSFRPSFKFYNKWISLFIGIICVFLMFLFDPLSGGSVCVLTVLIYISMLFVNPTKANWGPSTEEQFFNIARHLTFRLNVQDEHVKHYRPMILLLSGNPTNRIALVDMANHMTKRYGLLLLAHIAQGPIPFRTKDEITSKQKQWLKNENINAFYKLIESDSVSVGAKSFIQASGIGKFTPNIVMLGYKSNWQSCDSLDLIDYYQIIHSILDNNLSLIILRLREGHDFSAYLNIECYKPKNSSPHLHHTRKTSAIFSISKSMTSHNSINDFKDLANFEPNVDQLANRFKTQQTKGTIDVWWIYDDGGLTLLIPFILKNDALWRGSKLRVFSVTKDMNEINNQQNRLGIASLLNKFRIPYSAVRVLSNSDQMPSAETKNRFIKLMSKSMSALTDEQTVDSLQEEVIRFKDKTNRYLRLREQIADNSRNATLVVMTLPIPRKHMVSAILYMAWIETLTDNMPPTLPIPRKHMVSAILYMAWIETLTDNMPPKVLLIFPKGVLGNSFSITSPPLSLLTVLTSPSMY
ncbi:unnamed protein product, partial [Medioppia subpectinata]